MRNTALKIGILVVLIGIVMIGIVTSLGRVTLDCGEFVNNCIGGAGGTGCTERGQCQSGEYSGLLRGCKNGDPDVVRGPVRDANRYLRDRGYCLTSRFAVGSEGDFGLDYTKRIDPDGDCRWQAQRSRNNREVTLKDGPEPNPQPRPFCNSNDDLWYPFGCEVNSTRAWHRTC